jgi:hypothetical protein
MPLNLIPRRPVTKAKPGTPAFKVYLRRVYSWRSKVRHALFIPPGVPPRYVLRDPSMEDLARMYVADHGVCLACGTRTVTGGHCVTCGKVY